MLSTPEKLKIILDLRDEKQEVLADLLGKSRETVAKKLGIKSRAKPVKIFQEELIAILEYFEIELEDLKRADTFEQLQKLAHGTKRKRDHWNWIPVFDESQIADWTWTDLEFLHEAAAKEERAMTEDPDAFYFLAQGEHMTGYAPNGSTLREGHLLLVEPNAVKESGCLVLCFLEGQVSVKIWHKTNGTITLQSLAPNIAPVIVIDPGQEESLAVFRITRFTGRL